MADLTFPTMRGPMSTDGFPAGLILALRKYDDMRAEGNYEAADHAPGSRPTLSANTSPGFSAA